MLSSPRFARSGLPGGKTRKNTLSSVYFCYNKAMEKFGFPKDFYWGAATSAHQVEGNNHNDWSEWEKKTNHPISGQACDHYNRFREDFDIAKSLGHNAHRFSIEWSKIEPEEGKWDEKEIAHYQEVVNALRERGIEPFITLWHWTLPLWVAEQGGWENKKTINDFARYSEKVAVSVQGIKFWMPLNEPEFWLANAYGSKKFPAPRKSLFAGLKAYWHLISAHKIVYKKLKTINQSFSIGIVESTGWISPGPLRWILHDLRNYSFPWFVKGYFDFFGLNYYHQKTFFGKATKEVSDMGWEIYPEGIYKMIKGAYRRFKKPIYITENGLADSKDEKRAEFIQEHIRWIARASKEGADVRGYLHWSLMDNFEWSDGFWPRFGLVEINYDTMERKIRPSAWEYKKIIENNSIEI